MSKILLASLLAVGLMGQAAYAADSEGKPVKELTPQQGKMKNCNAEAKSKELKGDERKKFMSECLKAKS